MSNPLELLAFSPATAYNAALHPACFTDVYHMKQDSSVTETLII